MLSKWLTQFRDVLGKFFFPVIFGVFGLAVFGIIFSSVQQQSVDYQEGQVAEENIRANKTVENTTATNQRKQLAAEAVTPEYTYQEDLVTEQVDTVTQLFTLITQTNTEIDQQYQKEKAAAAEGETIPQPTIDERVAALKTKFESATDDQLTFYQDLPSRFYESIFAMTSDEILAVRDQAVESIEGAMNSRIRDDDVDTTREEAISQLTYLDITTSQQQAITYLINEGIVANEFLNERRTEQLQAEAEAAVQPVIIYQGEIIVREGNQIDAEAIEKLDLLGMTSSSTSIFPIIALAMGILLQIIVLVYFSRQLAEPIKTNFIIFYSFTMLMSVLMIKLFQLFDMGDLTYIPLFFPASFTPLLMSFFFNRRAGIISAIFQVIFTLLIYYDSAGTNSLTIVLLFYAFSGLLGTVVKRTRVSEQGLPATIWLIVFPMLLMLTLVVYQGMSFTEGATWMTLSCAFFSCALAYLLSVGLHPYIEQLFTDDSAIVLNELSNPNHPLLKQLLEEAPGTYHHSMMVANLSANAVAEIGGRSLLTRVACYYHDIGKIKHANFFVENLPEGAENPHNFLLPEDSCQIIFGHVIDGVRILTEAKMPQMIIDICQQHHGTTLMSYFYMKAEERNPDVKEADFRYPGPRPQTKEAGVVNIADSCEAAVRAMDNPTNEKIREFVHNLIETRISDGQLDESGLTLGEIRMVEQSLINGLASTFHSRIKYPKMRSEAEKMKEEQERRAE
ncbi:HD family phosphohydrolase [Enterococcus sp. LJL90]